MTQVPALSRSRLALVWSLPLLVGLVGLAMGKAASWDFLNYHWYNPHALLHGRLDMDMAVAHHATYYNPLLDVPFYLAARHLPGWLAGFLLATAQGLNLPLLCLLAYAVLPLDDDRQRFGAAVVLAVAGLGGAGAFGQIGESAGDNLASLGIIAMLLVLARQWPRLAAGRLAPALLAAAAAGLCGGLAAGSKLTVAHYAAGFGTILLFLPGPLPRRLLVLVAFGFGGAAGFLLTAGPWMLHLWRATGNPLFPYFNDLFRSPLLSEASFRDTRFLPQTLSDRLLFPLLFSLNSFRVAEFYFRDIHIGVLYLLAPPALLLHLLGRGREKAATAGLDTFLLLGAALSYLLWLKMFAIYRYLIVLEMLSPLLITMALYRLLPSRRAWLLSAGLVLVACQLAVSVEHSRKGWDGPFVAVEVPPIRDPQHSMVLMTGFEPLAYVIPSFPPAIPFIRIQGYLAGPGGKEGGYVKEMRRRVAAFQGDLLVLFHPAEEAAGREALAAFGLARVEGSCREVVSNIGPALQLCQVEAGQGGAGRPQP